MDNLRERGYYGKKFANILTVDTIIKSSSTFNKTVSIRAGYVTFYIFNFTFAFASCCNIFIPELIVNKSTMWRSTNGQVSERTTSKKLAWIEATSKANILLLIIGGHLDIW